MLARAYTISWLGERGSSPESSLRIDPLPMAVLTSRGERDAERVGEDNVNSTPEIVDEIQAVEWVGEERPEDQVTLFVIHDGRQVPRSLFGDRTEEVMARPRTRAAYVRERDWGAKLMASHLAHQLGLGGYLHVNLARLVMDYGRFPGDSERGVDHLLRYCFYPPFNALLTEAQKYQLLESCYDPVSRQVARRAMGKKITISVHTYDQTSETGTERPEVSLLARLLEHRPNSVLEPGLFDPLFPAILCEDSTCHRSLVYQMLLNLERGGHRTAINYPYLMPAGSLEIRGQVWFFFHHLRRRFHEQYPETKPQEPYRLVWRMLHDVDQRSADAARLKSFLHRFHAAPEGQRELFASARQAYGEIKRFLEENRRELVAEYRYSPERPSCLGIEVRKDLLCNLELHRLHTSLRADADVIAADVARHVAQAIHSFLEEEELTADLVGNLARPRLAS